MPNRDNRNETARTPARLLAAIVLALTIGTGYAISPRTVGAVDMPVAAAEQDDAEPYMESACVSDGLVLSDCLIDS